MFLSLVPVTHAYGAANYQVGFAGTGVLKGSGQQFGFWGWCDFAGGTGSPATSGTDADCKSNNYFQSPSGRIQLTQSIQGTAWDVKLNTCPPNPPGTCAPPGVTPFDFFITAGTVTLSGPFILLLEKSGPPPPVCTTTGTVITCPIWFLESVGFYSPDTGIPAAPGHYSFNSLLSLFPGATGELQIQVTQTS